MTEPRLPKKPDVITNSYVLTITFLDGTEEESVIGWHEVADGVLRCFAGYTAIPGGVLGYREVCAWPIIHIRKWEKWVKGQ